MTDEAERSDSPSGSQLEPQPTIETSRETLQETASDFLPDEPPLKRLIGSQRNPDAYRPQPSIPVVGTVGQQSENRSSKPSGALSVVPEGFTEELKTITYPPEGDQEENKATPAVSEDDFEDDDMPDRLSKDGEKSLKNVPVAKSSHKIEIPKVRGGKLSDELEDELDAVFGNQSLDELIARSESIADQDTLEPETKVKAKILAVQGDNVFLDVGAREQGLVSLNLFPPDAEPKVGDVIDVTIVRLNDGLYEVSVPLAAADVRDWSQVHEGMVVEAKITKTNTGGLECEVNRLRGFIPISQIDLFRVDDTEQYVGRKLTCVVEEVNPERRNLVLSRRAMLNRERDEKKANLLAELEVGQIREGLVRKIIDGGAFVDLGGVDGFIPISKISWGRINHPSDVLSEGTRVKVRVDRIEEGTNRISLCYRDDASNPWSNITERFQERSTARGRVTKIMEFGAFVELMPGVEGLIHISELSHKRVNNVREVVKEGEWIDVYVVSIDPPSKRIGLSIKQLAPEPVAESNEHKESGEAAKPEVLPPPVKTNRKKDAPLKGGTDQDGGGGRFGLKW